MFLNIIEMTNFTTIFEKQIFLLGLNFPAFL